MHPYGVSDGRQAGGTVVFVVDMCELVRVQRLAASVAGPEGEAPGAKGVEPGVLSGLVAGGERSAAFAAGMGFFEAVVHRFFYGVVEAGVVEVGAGGDMVSSVLHGVFGFWVYDFLSTYIFRSPVSRRVERQPPFMALHFEACTRTVSIHSIGKEMLSPTRNAFILGITCLARDNFFWLIY